MTIARYHRDMAEDYRRVKTPEHYERIAKTHDKEADRIEAQIYAILKDEERDSRN